MGLVAAVAAVVLSLVFGVVHAQSPTYSLKFNHVLAPNEPYHQGFLNSAKASRRAPRAVSRSRCSTARSSGTRRTSSSRSGKGRRSARTPMRRARELRQGHRRHERPYFAESLDDMDKLSEAPTIEWQKELASKRLKVVCFDWVQGLSALLH